MAERIINRILKLSLSLHLITSQVHASYPDASYPETLHEKEKPYPSAAAAAAGGTPLLRDDNKPYLPLHSGNSLDLKSLGQEPNPNLPVSSSLLLENKEERVPYQALADKILALTGATHDVRLEVKHALTQTLLPLIKPHKALMGSWNRLWSSTIAVDPEVLVGKESLLHKGEEQGFSRLHATLTEINTFKQSLVQVFPHDPSLASLDKLIDFYHSFKDQCLGKLDVLRHQKSSKAQSLFDQMFEPKAILMGELWPHQFFRISQPMAFHLLHLTEHGDRLPPISPSSTSNHRVSFLPTEKDGARQVFFKNDGIAPLNPSRDCMLSSLYQKLGIQAPATSLLIVENVHFRNPPQELKDASFILQASQAISGIKGEDVFKNNGFLPLEPDHFSRQVVGALLTTPVDGKPHNFVWTPLGEDKHGWVGIDNDEAFESPLLKDNIIHLKSALFLLPEMEFSLSPSYHRYLVNLVPEILLLEWLRGLEDQSQRYTSLHHLFSFYLTQKREGLSSKYLVDTIWENLSLPYASFRTSIVPTLLTQLGTLQNTLKSQREVTHQELLAICYPTISVTYKHLRQEYAHNLYEAYNVLHTGLQRSLPLNDHDPELTYFQENKASPLPLSAHKTSFLESIAEKDRLVDRTLKFYRSFVHQKAPFVRAALHSFKVLAQERFTSLHESRTMAELWARGKMEAKKLGLETEWREVFYPFRDQNSDLNWLFILEEYFPRGWTSETPSSTQIEGAFSGRRQLTPEMAEVLLKEGKFQKDPSLPGRGETTKYPPDSPLFYFKKYPEIPANEYAATLFMKRLGLKAPYNELFIFYHSQEGHYPVLLTEAIPGTPIYKCWDNDSSFTTLDPTHTGLMILSSLLLNFEDQKEDNVILSPDQKYLIPIDNDHVFLPGAIQVKELFKIIPQLQTKSLILSLKEMEKPLAPHVVEFIRALNINAFLQQWMQDLASFQDTYQMLPNQEASLWKNQGVTLRLPLSSLYIENLYRKFHLLQMLLVDQPEMAPLNLLLKLEPYAGKEYARVKKPTLKERFMGLTQGLYKSVKGNEARLSVATSRRIMEILEIDDQTLTSQLTSTRIGPQSALELLERLSQERNNPNSLLQRFLREETQERSPLSLQEDKAKVQQIFSTSTPYEIIELYYSSALRTVSLQSFKFTNKGPFISVADLRGAKNLREEDLMILMQICPHLVYLNISRWNIECLANYETIERGVFSTSFKASPNAVWPKLERLVLKGCPKLHTIEIHLPSLKSFELKNNDLLKKFDLKAPLLRYIHFPKHNIDEFNYILMII